MADYQKSPTYVTSQPPYYDDYEPDKGFYRVLYRPGFPVQARELTQSQTMLQDQLRAFGNHVFKEGSIVTGGQFNIDLDVPYVLLSTDDGNGNIIDPRDWEGRTVIGQTSGVQAKIIKVGKESLDGNILYPAFLRYVSGDENANSSEFSIGEILGDVGSSFATIKIVERFFGSVSIAGKGSMFEIQEGTLFSYGLFMRFTKQSVVLDWFSQKPTCRVGFFNTIDIVGYGDDDSLLDNAQGTPNYNAPGADRLKFFPTLSKIGINDTVSLPDFVESFTIKNGTILQEFQATQYDILGDNLARRTYDQSGDFTVRGHSVRVREHLDTGSNEGFYTEAEGGDSNKLMISVEPGTSYVKGFEVITQSSRYVEIDKATQYIQLDDQVLSARSSNYIIIYEIVGMPFLDSGTKIEIYASADSSSPEFQTGEARITNGIEASTSPTGLLLGTARVKSILYEKGTLGTTLGQLRLYLYDIRIDQTNGSLADASSVYCSSPSYFFADIVKNIITDKVDVFQKNQFPLLYYLGSPYIREIRDENNLADTLFQFQRTQEISTSNLVVPVTTRNEQFAYSSGTLTTTEKRTLFFCVAENCSVALSGTASNVGRVITGVSTNFSRLNARDRIAFSGVGGSYIIDYITSDTELTLLEEPITAVSGATITKIYFEGEYIDLTSKGATTGNVRSVECNDDRSIITIDLEETFIEGNVDALVSFSCVRSNGFEIQKILKPSRFVQINCAALENIYDPIGLGFADVFKIRQIRKKTGSVFTVASEGSDCTSDFIFNNGQRNDFYDHATITPYPGREPGLTDYLLIELDYFKPDFTIGSGYFSINSYPIDDTQESSTTIFTHEIPIYSSPINGYSYDLRGYIDFRTVKEPTATDATKVINATINPAKSDSFYVPTNGLRLPIPSSQIYLDYSFYLPRFDIIAMRTDGGIETITGATEKNPLSPSVPDNMMALSEIYIAPYPSLATTYARSIKRQDIGCKTRPLFIERYTMRDIGILKNRIKNVEDYVSLSLLETNAKELIIPDIEGNDRFKNGIFVDPFKNHLLGEATNPSYKICVDKELELIRPYFEMDHHNLQLLEDMSTNFTKGANFSITLPYTEETFIEQPNATSYRNIEQSVYRFIGNLELFPNTDNWIDTKTYDKTVEVDPFGGTDTPGTYTSTQWSSWETYATGYNVYQDLTSDVHAPNGKGSGVSVAGRDSDAALVRSFQNVPASEAAKYAADYARYEVLNPDTGEVEVIGTYDGRQIVGGQSGVLQTTENQMRAGLSKTTTISWDKQSLGSFVTDMSLQTYIRPQRIVVRAKGMKPYTRYHIYFDGEKMNDYCCPITIPTDWTGALNLDTNNGTTQAYNPKVTNMTAGTYGSPIKSNGAGDAIFYLALPSSGKRFRTGEKDLKITDSPTNAEDATSYAKSTFIAQGMSVTKQNTSLSVKVQQTDYSIQLQTKSNKSFTEFGPSCMAYSFLVDAPKTEEGIFLSSVDVWIQSIDDANRLGMWFEIREMDSAGGITRSQVPGSEVWMYYGDSRLKPTDDASEATNVNFAQPIFLLNDTQYAFVIHTEGLNPNTYFYVSRIGETDVNTGEQITSRRKTGTLFTTNNNLNWDQVQELDLTVRFNRAVFDTSKTATVYFGNQPVDTLIVTNRSAEFSDIGEDIYSTEVLGVNIDEGESTESIEIGDTIEGAVSGVSALVIGETPTGNWVTDADGFSVGEVITVYSSSPIVEKEVVATISSVQYGQGKLRDFDRISNQIILDNSSGHFFEGQQITGTTSGITAIIESVKDKQYSTSRLDLSQVILKNTAMQIYQKSYLSSAQEVEAAWKEISNRQNIETIYEKKLLSRTTEIENLSGANSFLIKVDMSSTSSYVSPIVDIERTSTVFVKNIINDDITNETYPTNGLLKNKYFSRPITLSEGQDAEDLLIILTAYAPAGITSYEYPIKIWVRILNRQDGDLLFQRNWIELEPKLDGANANDIYSLASNPFDFREVYFGFPEIFEANPEDGSPVQYQWSTNELNPGIQYISHGNVYTGFIQYQIKIGLLGNANNTALVPKVSNLRAIALQK